MKNVQKIPACLVHIFTGSGIIFSFMALVSVIEGYKLLTFMFSASFILNISLCIKKLRYIKIFKEDLDHN